MAQQPMIGQMNAFDLDGGGNWSRYVERLEQYFVANGIEDDPKQVAVLLCVMGEKPYELLHNLLAPTKPATKKFKELVEAMGAHLQPKPLVIAERFKFHKRNQSSKETVQQYLAELRKLADKCKFDAYLEEALRDRFVCGLRSEVMQRRLLGEDDLKLQRAVEIAHGMETASKGASEFHDTTQPTDSKAVPDGIMTLPGAKIPCFRCTKIGHSPDSCYFRHQKCKACGKTGHIAKACKTKASDKPENPYSGSKGRKSGGRYQKRGANTIVAENVTDDLELLAVQSNKTSDSRIQLQVEIQNVPLCMELDTGASVSLISKKVWKQQFSFMKLNRSDILLRTYTGEPLQVLGTFTTRVKYKEQQADLPLLVVDGNGPSLFGRNWLSSITLDWREIKRLSTGVDGLLQQYQEIFKDELGTLKGIYAKLTVKPEATPKFFKPRSVPYALKSAIEQDLQRLLKLGVIEKVNHSEWAAPIVPVPKEDQSVRICGDYKVTVNPVLQVDQFPLPKPEDLFASLAGGKKFTKLDLSHEYQQVLLHPDSRKYVTVNTHQGLYQYNRLPFGIASAPAVFQETMEKVLQGLHNVVCYIDDILVTGKTDDEHQANLEKVFQRLRDYGLRLKQSKCAFMVPSVEYLGYVIDAEGIRATPKKVEAITKAPKPKNTTELRLVNYYGKFIPHLASITQPLNQLLCKHARWQWSNNCEKAFNCLKTHLASEKVLVHYDISLPLQLACDASAYGVGAVISHVTENGDEKPIAYSSRTLSKSERNYSQIEKEALSIIYGVKKFHQFLYGRKFTLITDHKPLLAILGPKSQLPTLAAARFQRWAIYLSAYHYDLCFRPTAKHSNADGLSRLPMEESDNEQSVDVATIFNLRQIELLPVNVQQLRKATSRDSDLAKVIQYLRSGWPAKVIPTVQPYYHRRTELTIEAGCLLWGTRVIIPEKCRKQVLQELHTSHPGIVKMKSIARSHVWWPQIDKQIEKLVKSCTACQENKNNPPTATLHPWSWPGRPWQRIHIDFAGPFQGSMFMIVVDAHSKWLEVFPMNCTTTEKTLQVLRNLFARYGLPDQLVSDNGPQFTSDEFQQCMKANGIKHIRSAPYHAASNGEAERYVQTFKKSMKAGRKDPGTLHLKLAQFLLSYRSTPHSTTGLSPAELFLKRPLKTRLDLLHPSVETNVMQSQADQKVSHDARSKLRVFEIGDSVWVKNLRGEPNWLQGTILEKTGPVSYRVSVNDQIWRRHVDQLRLNEGIATNTGPSPETDFDFPTPTVMDTSNNSEETITVDSQPTEATDTERRYPQRTRKPTQRLIEENS